VRYDEGMEKGRQEGMERGMEKGRQAGMKTVAINALTMGYSVEQVNEITGLDTRTITELSYGVQ